ncbi:hypothetical protein Tco_0066187 [Tanacetum coccineum]
MARRGSKNTINARMERRGQQEIVTPEVLLPEVDDRYVYREKFALCRVGPDHLQIICRNEEEKDIVLHFKMQDVYLVGFMLGDVAYEFRLNKKGDEDGDEFVHELPSSIFLPFKPTYSAMGAVDMTSINIGYEPFKNALMEMIDHTPDSRNN